MPPKVTLGGSPIVDILRTWAYLLYHELYSNLYLNLFVYVIIYVIRSLYKEEVTDKKKRVKLSYSYVFLLLVPSSRIFLLFY